MTRSNITPDELVRVGPESGSDTSGRHRPEGDVNRFWTHGATVTTPCDLPSLTALRAFAALLVFAYHLHIWQVLRFGVLFTPGYTGVSFFFILSGFILNWGHKADVPVATFYVKRIARIYPSHLVMFFVALAVPVAAHAIRLPTVLANLLLVQAWVPVTDITYGVNSVTWSLSCELAFYAAFPFVVKLVRTWSIRSLGIATAVSLVASGIFVLSSSILPDPPEFFGLVAYANPLVRFPEFLLGIFLSRALTHGWKPTLLTVVTITSACGVGLVMFHNSPAPDVWVPPVFGLVIFGSAHRDLGRNTWLANRRLVYAGKISFAFYLVHELTILNVRHYLGPGAGTAATALAIAVPAAALLHHAVEMPAQRLITACLRPSTTSAPDVITGPVPGCSAKEG